MKVIDFTNLGAKETIKLNEIANKNRSEYVRFIDGISKEYSSSLLWWLTPFATRSSEYTYTNLYKLLLIDDYLKSDSELQQIIIDSRYLYKCIKKNFRKSNVKIKISKSNKKDGFVSRFFYFFVVWIKELGKWFIIRKTKDNNFKIKTAITLIDSYLMSSCVFSNGIYKDRYFNNIIENSDKSLTFSATLINNKDEPFSKFIEKVRGIKNYTFLIKQDFLKITDYVKILKYPFFCIGLLKRNYRYNDFDISDIVRGNIINDIPNENTFNGFYSYGFIKRLKKNNIRINKLLCWYEGQPSTIGMIIAMKKYYPTKQIIGYVGLPIPENMLGFYPSEEEVRQESVPDIFAVIGSVYKSVINEFCNDVRVKVVPAFRFPNVKKKYNCDLSQRKGKYILIVLPYTRKLCSILLTEVFNALKKLNKQDIKLYIKNHPNNIELRLDDYGLDNVENSIFVEGDLIEQAQKMDIVVVTKSTSCMEIISQGVFLIVYEAGGELINDAIPKTVPKSCYQRVYSEEELIDSFQSTHDTVPGLDGELLNQFFVPISRESVSCLFE